MHKRFRLTTVICSSPFFFIAIAALCLSGTLLPIADALYFNAGLVAEGQIWRAFTAWFVQANVTHWVINLGGLLIIAFVLPSPLTRASCIAFVAIWLFASLCLLWSDYPAYVGLSGVLYGWLFWAIAVSPFYGAALKTLVLALISAKVLIENSALSWLKDSLVAQWVGHEIAYESHLWGLLGGIMAWSLYWLTRRFLLNAEPRG